MADGETTRPIEESSRPISESIHAEEHHGGSEKGSGGSIGGGIEFGVERGKRENKIFIGNLPSDATEEELRELFEPYAHVEVIELKCEKGFAFAQFNNFAICQTVIQRLTHPTIRGTVILRLEHARGPDNRVPGRFPGDGGCFHCGEVGHWARECRSKDRYADRDRYRPEERHRHDDRRERDSDRGHYERRPAAYDERRERYDDRHERDLRRDSERDYGRESYREPLPPSRYDDRRERDLGRDAYRGASERDMPPRDSYGSRGDAYSARSASERDPYLRGPGSAPAGYLDDRRRPPPEEYRREYAAPPSRDGYYAGGASERDRGYERREQPAYPGESSLGPRGGYDDYTRGGPPPSHYGSGAGYGSTDYGTRGPPLSAWRGDEYGARSGSGEADAYRGGSSAYSSGSSRDRPPPGYDSRSRSGSGAGAGAGAGAGYSSRDSVGPDYRSREPDRRFDPYSRPSAPPPRSGGYRD